MEGLTQGIWESGQMKDMKKNQYFTSSESAKLCCFFLLVLEPLGVWFSDFLV